MPPIHACTRMHTPTQEAFYFLTRKAPAVIGQSGHVQLHIPGERKVIGHLEPDAQPNAALCCPEQNQFCWQEDGTQLLGQPTGSPTDCDPLPPSRPPQQRVLSFRSSRERQREIMLQNALGCHAEAGAPSSQVRMYLHVKLEAVHVLIRTTNSDQHRCPCHSGTDNLVVKTVNR